MPLPKLGTGGWEELLKKYSGSTRIERDQMAKELCYTGRQHFQTCMSRRGIYVEEKRPEPQSPISLPEPQPIIYPAPKIELRPPPVQDEREEDEAQLVLISDAQVGLKTKTYNAKVFAKRTLRQYNALCRFADIHRKFCPVKQLNLFFLGDDVHGELIGKQIMLDELEMPLRDQKWVAVNEYSNLIINACQWYETIEVDCIPGNHGIMGRMFSQSTNWSLEVYDLLKVALSNYPQVKLNVVADDFYFIRKIKNTKFLGLHGDKIPMYLSLPFYGIDRRSLRWKQSLPEWDILTMGHFHTCSFFQASGIPIFINGTVCSDSRWIAQWLGIKEIAESWTMFIGQKYGVTAMHKIDLMREEG